MFRVEVQKTVIRLEIYEKPLTSSVSKSDA